MRRSGSRAGEGEGTREGGGDCPVIAEPNTRSVRRRVWRGLGWAEGRRGVGQFFCLFLLRGWVVQECRHKSTGSSV